MTLALNNSPCHPFHPGHRLLSNSFVTTLFLCLLSTIILCPPANATSSEQRLVEKKAISQKIETTHITINSLEHGIKQKQEQVEESKQQERCLLAELEGIDNRLHEQLKKQEGLKQKMASQKELIRLKEMQLEQSRLAKNSVRLYLQKRMKAYYKTGPIGIVNVIFSTETLPELLQFHESFHSLIAYDKKVMTHYRATIDELEQNKAIFLREKSLLQDFINQTTLKKEAINTIRAEKNILLSQIRTQKQLYEQAVKEMEKATDSLVANLDELKNKEKLLDQGFLLNKGQLPAPVPGTVLTLFGEEKTNSLGISRKSTGISIRAANGTPVRAVFEGTLLYSAYLRGYGKTIIIDHGHNYYSIISRMEKLLRKKGAKVNQGELIGVVGETATLLDHGLHFEIRHGKNLEDPLFWLNKNDLYFPE